MTSLTKAKFEKILTEIANAKNVDTKMVIAEREVNNCDLNLIEGKWVEALRKLSYHYNRMWSREMDGEALPVGYEDHTGYEG